MKIPTSSTFYLVGATAVGKTDFAVLLAEALGAEIVGCDAFQLYEGLPLLTAKPDTEALTRVPHHLIGEIPLSRAFDVAQYRQLALERISEIHERGKAALVVGGTGLYLRALTRGLADIPQADPELRLRLETKDLIELKTALERLDPAAFAHIDLKNRRRVIRALEVCILTGRPFSSFREEWDEIPPGLRGILLERNRDELYRRIDQRVEGMFVSGVLDEVANADPIGLTAAQTLGLRELQGVLSGRISSEEAALSIKQATRRYAKRQSTWFRREPWLSGINLSTPSGLSEQIVLAANLLTQ